MKVYASSLRSEFGKPIYILISCNRLACTDRISRSEKECYTRRLAWIIKIALHILVRRVRDIVLIICIKKIISWSGPPKRATLIF
uniref:Uncharacterized protein n=1 Tax=Klebsiella pneumoniae TaxID=573 RepID=A0A8B0SUN4_KLEPN|nr:hypothetical protein [Klebsiella pneumoniae]